MNPLAVKFLQPPPPPPPTRRREGGRERRDKTKTYNALLLSLPFPPFSPPTAGNNWALNKKSCGALRAKSPQGTHMGEQRPLLQVKKHWRFIFSFSSAAHFRPFMYRFEVKKNLGQCSAGRQEGSYLLSGFHLCSVCMQSAPVAADPRNDGQCT